MFLNFAGKYLILIVILSIFSRYRYRDRTVPLLSRYLFTLAFPIVQHCHRPTFLTVSHHFPQTVPDHFLPILTVFNVKGYFLEKLIIFAWKLGPLRYLIFKFFELILLNIDNKRSLNQLLIIFLKSQSFKAFNTFYQN